MSYTPTAWQTGDVVTAEKLNKLEEGVADAQCFIVHVTKTFGEAVNLSADVSYSDLKQQLLNGRICVAQYVEYFGGEKTTVETAFACFIAADGETQPEVIEFRFIHLLEKYYHPDGTINDGAVQPSVG